MDFQENDNNTQELMSIFQNETEEIIEHVYEHLDSLMKKPDDRELIATLYREMHSLKGAIRMVGFGNIQTIIHKIEDIFDFIKENGIFLDNEKITIIIKSVELVAKYLEESVNNGREIIDEEFKSTVSTLEYLCDVDLLSDVLAPAPSVIEKNPQSDGASINNLELNQEQINASFNTCFEIIDGIVPEEESQEIIILKEEVNKIYDTIKDFDLYEVKTALQNVSAKLDFVMNASGTLTISEILELRNEITRNMNLVL